jgi:crotonobetainyl-CoA:carnitine CoA-transferase CaiB-like acyl-CoA transferase
MEHGEVIARAIDELRQRYDRPGLFHEGQRRRLLVMPVNTVEDLLVDEQLQARDYFAQIEHPELGRTLTDAGVPYHFSATPARVHRRAPLLGEHTEEVFREWIGMSAEELEELAAEAVV